MFRHYYGQQFDRVMLHWAGKHLRIKSWKVSRNVFGDVHESRRVCLPHGFFASHCFKLFSKTQGMLTSQSIDFETVLIEERRFLFSTT
jgi:hypothetical protein